MSATDLIEEGKMNRDKVGNNAQETRAIFALGRCGFKHGGDYKEGIEVHATEIIESIRSGQAWHFRNVGDKTVQLWAEWVTGERHPPPKLKVIYDTRSNDNRIPEQRPSKVRRDWHDWARCLVGLHHGGI